MVIHNDWKMHNEEIMSSLIETFLMLVKGSFLCNTEKGTKCSIKMPIIYQPNKTKYYIFLFSQQFPWETKTNNVSDYFSVLCNLPSLFVAPVGPTKDVNLKKKTHNYIVSLF